MDTFWLESVNRPQFFVRHRNFLGELSEEVVGQEADFAFTIVNRGHDRHGGQLVGLRAVNYPLFLRHRDFRIHLDGRDAPNPQLFDADSTFVLEHGLAAGPGSTAISFRSVNYPNRFIRHRDFHLWLEEPASPQDRLFLSDATFSRSVPLDQRATL